jgi:pantoate--beta-alanine ligase
MELLSSNSALDHYLASHGTGCVLVPTMGALHAGHADLVRRAANLARDRRAPGGAIVTIFVNPTQFNDPADLARYPRTLDADLALCKSRGAAAVFAPTPADIYPPGLTIPVPPLPAVATAPALEDAHRPGHFAGVAQVVRRLFDLTRPSAAIFGEKDWQQLALIRALAAAGHATANPPSPEIVPAPTVREPSGLAMSSRNRFLSAAEREQAAAIHRALRDASSAATASAAEALMRSALESSGLRVEYAVVRHALTLAPLTPLAPVPPGSPPPEARALIAARLGSVRLIDNAPWPRVQPL